MTNNTNNSLRTIRDESLKLGDNEQKGVGKLLYMLLTLRQQRVLRSSFEKENERNQKQ